MALGLIGRKLRMTRIFDDRGISLPATIIQAGPCRVVTVKEGNGTGEKVVQLGFQEMKKERVNKPLAGFYKKAKVVPCKLLRDFRVPGGKKVPELKAGDELTVGIFAVGEKVNVRAKSKGRGFLGVVKRHNFRTPDKSHGQSDRLRAPGSIGQSSSPSRVWKGMKMPGKTGSRWTTIRNLEILRVNLEDHIILVRGAVPGTSDNYLVVKKLT